MKLDGNINSALMGLKAEQRPGGTNSGGTEPSREVEALLIRKVVEAMRKTVPEGGLGASGRQMHDYLVEEALTQALKDGGGMGMDRMFDTQARLQKPNGLAGVVRSSERSWADVHPDLTPSQSPLMDQMPPSKDAFLDGPNPEQELQRLLLGAGGVTPTATVGESIERNEELAARMPPSRDSWDHQGQSAEATLLSILSEGN